MDQSPSLEDNGHSASQEIPCLLCRLKVHYCVKKSTGAYPEPDVLNFPYSL